MSTASGLKSLLPRALLGWAGARWVWARTLLNYALMRLSRRGRLFRVGAWPHALYIEGTNICNAKCVFCAYPDMRRPKQVMPLELFRSIIDQYAALGGTEIDLTPIVGDPFVDGKIFERLDYVNAKAGIRRFHFFTNAIGMRPELGQRLLAYGERLQVYISLGGFDRETYAKTFGVDKFDAVEPNIRALLEAKLRAASTLKVQLNLRTPKDSHRGPFWDYLLEMKGRGAVEMTWMGAYDSWAGQIQDQDLRDAGLLPRAAPVKRGACHRLLTSPTVLADGRVNACACRDVEASLVIGDLKSRSLEDILTGPELHKLVARHASGDLPEVCRRCTYYDSILPDWMLGGTRQPDPETPVQ